MSTEVDYIIDYDCAGKDIRKGISYLIEDIEQNLDDLVDIYVIVKRSEDDVEVCRFKKEASEEGESPVWLSLLKVSTVRYDFIVPNSKTKSLSGYTLIAEVRFIANDEDMEDQNDDDIVIFPVSRGKLRENTVKDA